MPITRPDFENLCEADLQTLLDNEVPEGIHIEYKRELYGGTDSEKKEFLKDVSSFANTAGGHIVIGIAATDGVPTELRGLAVGNLDSEQQRFESLLRDRMEPRIVGIRMAPVALKNGLRALAIRIPRSWNLPHAVMHNKARLVFARNSVGAHEASVDEMRAMFLAGATFLDRARDFHRERLKIIHENMCERVRRFLPAIFSVRQPSQKNPRYWSHINHRVAKLGNAYTGQPPHEIGHLCGARPTPPGGGTPSISLIPPKAVVVVDVAELAHKPARLGVSAVHYRPTWSAHETG